MSGSLVSRRAFLAASGGAVAAGFLGLRTFLQQEAAAATAWNFELLPDPEGYFDLPAGFSYRIISRMGEKMRDGLLVPGAFDGMAAFPGPDGRVVIIRNHELIPSTTDLGAFGKDNALAKNVDPRVLYDPGHGRWPGLGGTSTIVYDPATGTTERQFMSLMGTDRNCAGGMTPWGTWISCEEVDSREKMLERAAMYERPHGYNFEVSPSANGAVEPSPIKAMGRFRHEAIAVDPATGVVYQTEDVGSGLITRYIPAVPGQLAAGGKLQALCLRDLARGDTRNWKEAIVREREPLAVSWIDLEDIDNPEDDLRYRAARQGAAIFARGEGMWYGGGSVYFACTDGGKTRTGQIWKLTPSAEGDRLELFAEPNHHTMLQNGDNLTVAPWGDLIVCEDHTPKAAKRPAFLVGITPHGRLYTLGRNRHNDSELSGACFSPDGRILFVNIMFPGLTLAITGPWRELARDAHA